MTADIVTAYFTAPIEEKVWSTAGREFGDREGAMIEISRALYG